MKAFSKYIDVICFYILACTLTWVWWGPMDVLVLKYPSFKILHLVGSLGPALAAVCMIYGSGKADVIRQFKNSMTFSKKHSGRYLIWFLVPLVAFFGSVLLEIAVRGTSYDLRLFFSTKEYENLGIVYWLFSIVFYGFGEEVGWRGYLLPKLRSMGYSSKRAAVFMTPLWAFWHVPLFFYVNSNYASMSGWMMLGWLISLLFGAVLLNYIYYSTGKSIWAAALFHASLDIAVMNLLAQKAVLSANVVNGVIMSLGLIALLVRHPEVVGAEADG